MRPPGPSWADDETTGEDTDGKSTGEPQGIVTLYDGIPTTLVRTLVLGATFAGFALFMVSSSEYGISGTGVVLDSSRGDVLPIPLSFHVWTAAVAVPLFLATQIRPAPAGDDQHDQVQAYVLDLTTFLVAGAASVGSITTVAVNLAHHERLDVVALAAWPLYAALASAVRGDRPLVRPQLVQRDLTAVQARLGAQPGPASVVHRTARSGRHGHRRGTAPPPAASTRADAAFSRTAVRRWQFRLWARWVRAIAAAQLAWLLLLTATFRLFPLPGASGLDPTALLLRATAVTLYQGLATGVLAFLAVEAFSQWRARRWMEALATGLMAGCLAGMEIAGVLIALEDGMLGDSQSLFDLIWAIGSAGCVLVASLVYAPATAWGQLHQWRSLTAHERALAAVLPRR